MKNTDTPPSDKPDVPLLVRVQDPRVLGNELHALFQQVIPHVPAEDLGGGNTLSSRFSLLMGVAIGTLWRLADVPVEGVCRICGCTDELGCENGCAWVTPDLCSRCAPFLEAAREGVVFEDLATPAPAPKVRAAPLRRKPDSRKRPRSRR